MINYQNPINNSQKVLKHMIENENKGRPTHKKQFFNIIHRAKHRIKKAENKKEMEKDKNNNKKYNRVVLPKKKQQNQKKTSSNNDQKTRKHKDKKKKICDKEKKLENRVYNCTVDPLETCPRQEEFKRIFQSFQANLKQSNVEEIPKVYYKIKLNLEQKLKLQDYETGLGEVGFYVLQIIMLIAKLIIYQEIFCQEIVCGKYTKMLIQDLIIALNDNQISSAINQIYQALTGEGHLNMEKSYWKGLVDKLKYQLEVDRQHDKSNHTNYQIFQKDKASQACRECKQKIDETWSKSKFKDKNNNDKSYPSRPEFKDAIKRGLLEWFIVNHQMQCYMNNHQRKNQRKPDIYLDCILNVISGGFLLE